MRVKKQGLYQLEEADVFNLLVVPPDTADKDLIQADWDAVVTCAHGRRALALVDAPAGWRSLNFRRQHAARPGRS
jgi:hypothetical protein